jgi:hypothetical protein
MNLNIRRNIEIVDSKPVSEPNSLPMPAVALFAISYIIDELPGKLRGFPAVI